MTKKIKQPSVHEQYENLNADQKRRIQQHGTENGHRVAKIRGSGPENPIKVLKRVLNYAFRNKLAAALLVILIVLSSAAGAVGSFMLTFVIGAIEDMVNGVQGAQQELLSWTIALICVYVVGVLSTFSYSRLMMFIAQGALKRMRDEMFINMQYLPLRYFDTHSHGELMSRYTNDVDTLRQMLSQSVPQMISAVVTIVVVFLCMVFMSFTLTLVMLVILSVNIVCIKFIGAESSRQFLKQQISIGKVNGYVEEMMEGQKVVKVFCHEDKARERFHQINEELRVSGRDILCHAQRRRAFALQCSLRRRHRSIYRRRCKRAYSIPYAHTLLQPACTAGDNAVQRNRHGTCGCRAHIRYFRYPARRQG